MNKTCATRADKVNKMFLPRGACSQTKTLNTGAICGALFHAVTDWPCASRNISLVEFARFRLVTARVSQRLLYFRTALRAEYLTPAVRFYNGVTRQPGMTVSCRLISVGVHLVAKAFSNLRSCCHLVRISGRSRL